MGPDARVLLGHDLVGNRLELGDRERVECAADRPGQDPPDVDVDGAHAPPEGQGGDRPRCVRSDARQASQGVEVVRNPASVVAHDRDGRRPQGQRPPVVAEPAPGAEDGSGCCLRKRLDRRELDEEAGPVFGRAGGLGLLGHGLGHQDGVRIAGRPEGEIAAARGVPVKDRSLKHRDGGHRVER